MTGARHAVDGRAVAVGLGGPGRGGLGVEGNGITVIVNAERRCRPRQLFWPWFAANVSVLGVAYGAFVLGFGLSPAQALGAGLAGLVLSFALCGVVALAGRRGSSPTMVLSRAAFGVRGNRLPTLVSWLLTVGWETVLTVTATLVVSTVCLRLGWGAGPLTQLVALVVTVALTVAASMLRVAVVLRLQAVLTVVVAALAAAYLVLTGPTVDWAAAAAVPPGSAQAVIGAMVFCLTGFGLGWVNVAADYSRYLPRDAPARAVIGWTTVGGALAPAVLMVAGLLLAVTSPELAPAVAGDPVGALTGGLPTWFLVPFAVVAVLSLIGSSVLNLHSSGLALRAAGVRVRRPVAALLDGAVMAAGAAYVVFVSGDFLGQFRGFLVTFGVPVAAWCGVLVADVARRREDYDHNDLYRRGGRYGDVQPFPLLVVVAATALGWGLVVDPAARWLAWQGYLLGPLGGPDGPWAPADVGVLVALVVPFLVCLATGDRWRLTPHGRR